MIKKLMVMISALLLAVSPSFAQGGSVSEQAGVGFYMASQKQPSTRSDQLSELQSNNSSLQTTIVSYGVRYTLSDPEQSARRVQVAAGVGDFKSRSVGVSLQIRW